MEQVPVLFFPQFHHTSLKNSRGNILCLVEAVFLVRTSVMLYARNQVAKLYPDIVPAVLNASKNS